MFKILKAFGILEQTVRANKKLYEGTKANNLSQGREIKPFELLAGVSKGNYVRVRHEASNSQWC